MRFYIGYLLFLFIFSSQLYSQNVDSLQIQLESHLEKYGEDAIALNLLKKIFVEVKDNQQYALEIAGQAMIIASNNGDKQNEALMYQWIAGIYRQQKVYYLAMDYYFKAVKLYQELENKEDEANCYIKLGETYIEQNVEELAQQYFINANNIFIKLGNSEGIALALKSLGDLYFRQGSYDMAFKQYEDALNGLSSDESEIIAALYLSMAKVNIEEEEYESAIEFLRKALLKYKLKKKMKQVAEIYVQYGEVYLKQKQFNKALTNFENALFISREIQDFNRITENYNKIAYIYYRSKNYEESIIQSQNSLNYNDNYLKESERSYLYLSRANEKLNKSKEAHEYLKKYLRIHDRIFEDQENKQFNEMQLSLELQRHEKEVELLVRDQEIQDEALKRSKLQTYFLMFGVLFFVLFAYYYYRTNERTKRASREILRQKEELSSANSAILKQQALIERKNKDIEAGMNYAHRIQFALIPEVAQLHKILPQSIVYLKPKDQISGDFYWFTRKRHVNKIFLAAVDCTGHGVPGAFMSVLGNTLLNQIIGSGIYEADEILNNLHKMVRQALHQDTTTNRDGMDMTICVIDTEKRQVDFSGAKNQLLYFVDNEMKQIKGDMFSIGGIQREKERRFTKHTIDLPMHQNSVFYMFSDGFQDQFGGEYKQKFTRHRLRAMFQDIHNLEFDKQFPAIEHSFNEWKGKYEQLDDVLILGFRI
ncbi:MAG: tetratricopeptide repeat protein [Bacteroidales bacterium]|nr:tetratricopeptide repeat protein [Bacteroidales bacterium]